MTKSTCWMAGLVAVLTACGGLEEPDSAPVALCPGENMSGAVERAAESIGLDYEMDCAAEDAVHVVWDGPVWDNGRCQPGDDVVCVASCTVAGECALDARVELALLEAGY